MIHKFMRCAATALCCLPTISIAASDDSKELERALAKVRSEPMIFVVATGEPNACGRGCTEWIAAEGRFDEGAAQRFREFLAVLAKRDLPIFFNSDGGLVREAVQIGLILRENRMTAGVARTVAEGCHLSFPLDDACRRLMQSKREHRQGCTSAERAVDRRAFMQWLAPRGPRRHASNSFRRGRRNRQGREFLAA